VTVAAAAVGRGGGGQGGEADGRNATKWLGRALSSISSGRSCGTAGISGEITEFAIRAGLKYLVGVSRDVARRTEGGGRDGGWMERGTPVDKFIHVFGV